MQKQLRLFFAICLAVVVVSVGVFTQLQTNEPQKGQLALASVEAATTTVTIALPKDDSAEFKKMMWTHKTIPTTTTAVPKVKASSTATVHATVRVAPVKVEVIKEVKEVVPVPVDPNNPAFKDGCWDSTGLPPSNRGLGECLAKNLYGWEGRQWECLDDLWGTLDNGKVLESGWNQHADNPGSTAYGIPQALPGSKMGAGWASDVRVQIVWGLSYVASDRYGTPCEALDYRLSHGSY